MIYAFKRSRAAAALVFAASVLVTVLIWVRDREYPVYIPLIASLLMLTIGVLAARLLGNVLASMENTRYLGYLHMELDPKKFLEHYREVQSGGALDRRSCYALKLPVMPQFRKIACIRGEYVLKDNEHATRFEDSVGLAADWRKSGYVWEIPYRTLYPEKGPGGLLAAGRCSSASGDAWEVTRVIPVAAMTGQAAGLAAAMAIDADVDARDLRVPELQAELRKLGFAIHLDEAGL